MRSMTPGHALIIRVSQYLQGARTLEGVSGLEAQTVADLSAMRREIAQMDALEIAAFRRPRVDWRADPGAIVPLPLYGRRSSSVRSGLVRSGVKISEVGLPEFATHAARRTIEAQRAARNALGVTTVQAPGSIEAVCYARAHYLVDPKILGSGDRVRAVLPAGRYCFGVLDQDGFTFEETVWPCPGAVTLTVATRGAARSPQ